jgi:hypothetical protein
VLLGVPVLVAVLSGVVWVERGNRALADAIAEADRLDPRWRLEEIEADRAAPPPAGENGAEKVAAAKRLLPKRWRGSPALSLLNEGPLPPANRLGAEQLAILRNALQQVGPALAEARSLIGTPRGRHSIKYAPGWFYSNVDWELGVYSVRDLLRLDALGKTEAGDFDGAVRSTHALFHAGCSIGDEPNDGSQICRFGCEELAVKKLERALAQGQPSDEVLVAFQSRIEAEEPAPLFLIAMRGERAGFHFLFDNLRNGSVAVSDVGFELRRRKATFDERFVELVGSLPAQQGVCLHYMNEMVEIAKLPPEQWAEPLAAQQAKSKELPELVQKIVDNAVRYAPMGFQRKHATLRCGFVAIAAERYRRQKGQWPATPDYLVKAGLLKSVPSDPYLAGARIRFARQPDGLIVYTVGENGVDDGGNLTTTEEKPFPLDIGFRLWDVAARRQPPLPWTPPPNEEQ